MDNSGHDSYDAAMAINEWWVGEPGEVYWLEITDRLDVGTDLKAPQRRDDGTDFWGYSLIQHVRHGDIVFHYDKGLHAITSWSRVAGGWWEDDIVWAAHGTTARSGHVQPYLRPGWKIGLNDHASLSRPLTLREVRQRGEAVLRVEADLQARIDGPLYLAFSRYGPTVRTQQGYLAKLPKAIVEYFDPLREAAEIAAQTEVTSAQTAGDRATAAGTELGSTYRPADEDVSISARDPMFPDPALVERGNRGHAKAQNALADALEGCGTTPMSPKPGEPNYDLAWTWGGRTWVAEVKSLTSANEERQLRLAIGQVLRFAHVLAQGGRPVSRMVMVERPPSDETWMDLCSDLGIVLLWPAILPDLIEILGAASTSTAR